MTTTLIEKNDKRALFAVRTEDGREGVLTVFLEDGAFNGWFWTGDKTLLEADGETLTDELQEALDDAGEQLGLD